MAKGYSEPTNYFSKETLKKYKLGEYNTDDQEEQKKEKKKEITNEELRDYLKK